MSARIDIAPDMMSICVLVVQQTWMTKMNLILLSLVLRKRNVCFLYPTFRDDDELNSRYFIDNLHSTLWNEVDSCCNEWYDDAIIEVLYVSISMIETAGWIWSQNDISTSDLYFLMQVRNISLKSTKINILPNRRNVFLNFTAWRYW